jgi:selT/selW/selH-like putative selenoprotein
MKRNFVQVAQFLESEFPELRGNISGNIYPLPPIAALLTNVLTVFQMCGMAWIMLGGDKLFRMIGYRNELPAFYHTIQNNPIPIGMFLFLLAPQMIGKFQNNGAFEIYLDDKEIFSKLAVGSFPRGDYLVSALVSAGLKKVE